jgi:F0F1-type ATP synthase epsilon subunit
MKRNFELKIYTSAGLFLIDIVREVRFPGAEGEIGILPFHCYYTSTLGNGILMYVDADSNETRRIKISGGFCNFADDTLTILTDQVEELNGAEVPNHAS